MVYLKNCFCSLFNGLLCYRIAPDELLYIKTLYLFSKFIILFQNSTIPSELVDPLTKSQAEKKKEQQKMRFVMFKCFLKLIHISFIFFVRLKKGIFTVNF